MTRAVRGLSTVGRGLAVAVVLVVVAGCSAVPSSGPPHAVSQVPAAEGADGPNVRSQPNVPHDGDSPERIVRGFLLAAKSSAGKYGIAREFLTSHGSQTWRTSGDTQVISLGAVTSADKGSTVTATAKRKGTVSAADGSFAVDGSPVTFQFRLKRVDKQWRIDAPPRGVLVLDSDFAQIYRTANLYYLNGPGDRVVADRRYLAVEQGALATEMVDRLLQRPSAWLAPGVHSAFPVGTKLRTNVVADGDGLVVDLTEQADSATPDTRRSMAAQLAWTLQYLGTSGVQITVEGRPFSVPDQGRTASVDHYSSYDPDQVGGDAYYLANGTLTTLEGKTVQGKARSPVTGLESGAVSNDLSQFAGVRKRSGGGRELIAGPLRGATASRLTGQAISEPSWGAGSDAVFTVVDHKRVVRVRRGKGVDAVDARSGVRTGPLNSIRASRDGVRVAMLVGASGDRRLLVGVLSNRGGVWKITGLQASAPDLTDVSSVSWSDSQSLGVIARRGGAMTPWTVQYDGSDVEQGTLSGLPDPPTVLATTAQEGRYPDLAESDGQIWRRSGSSWVPPNNEDPVAGTDPFYPG